MITSMREDSLTVVAKWAFDVLLTLPHHQYFNRLATAQVLNYHPSFIQVLL